MSSRLFFALLLCVSFVVATTSNAFVFSVTNNNSYITADSEPISGFNENGLINWFVDDTSQLVQQWYWFRQGAGNQSSLNALNPVVGEIPNPNQIHLSYSNVDPFDVHILYTLTGFANGSGHSLLTEQITITNRNASTLSLAWFEYTDFDLSGPSSTFNDHASGGVSGITQSDPLMTASVTHSLTPDRFEIASTSPGYNFLLFDALDDTNTIYNLSNLGSPSSTGDVTFAFQWNLSIAANDSLTFTTTKEINLIPEPGTALLLALGFVGLIAAHRRRK